jgi:hypothetical protein
MEQPKPVAFRCFGGCRVRNSRVTNLAASRTPLDSGSKERDRRVGESGPDSKRIPA